MGTKDGRATHGGDEGQLFIYYMDRGDYEYKAVSDLVSSCSVLKMSTYPA